MPFPRLPVVRRRPVRPPADSAATRTMSLCPPLFPETTWGERLRDTVDRLVAPWWPVGPTVPGAAAAPSRLVAPTRPWTPTGDAEALPARRALRALQGEFVAALADLHTATADAVAGAEALQTRVRTAVGERDLWNLRPAVFDLLSRHRGEAEARRRVAALDRHFPRRVAGAPITGRDRGG